MSATVRKNFVLNEEVASHLDELAKESNKSMTALVQEMIEEKYASIKAKKRLKAFKRSQEIAHSFSSGLLVGKSIQSIKAEMDV